jgi:hypothetical protein
VVDARFARQTLHRDTEGKQTMTISMRRSVLRAGAVLLLGLAAIGLVQAVSADGTPAAPLANAPVGNGPVGNGPVAGTGATADDALASELDAILAADQTAAQPAVAGPNAAPRILGRLRIGRRLVHGTIVVDLPKAGLTTVQVDHGTISSVGATSLAISEAGGTSVTVTLDDKTRVRRNGAKAAIADLKTGDEVFVMSRVASGGTIAAVVVVPKA